MLRGSYNTGGPVLVIFTKYMKTVQRTKWLSMTEWEIAAYFERKLLIGEQEILMLKHHMSVQRV